MRITLAVLFTLLILTSEGAAQESNGVQWAAFELSEAVDFGSATGGESTTWLKLDLDDGQSWAWGAGIGGAIGGLGGAAVGFFLENLMSDGNFRIGRGTAGAAAIGVGVGALLGAAVGHQLGQS